MQALLCPAGVPTLADIWQSYQDKHFPSITKKSRECWHYSWAHIAQPLGKRCLSDISKADLKTLWTCMQKKGKSAQTIRLVLQLIRLLFNRAAEWGLYTGENPMRGFTLPKLDNARLRWLTHTEADALLAALQKRSLSVYYIALISLHTGMRRSEILNISAHDVHFDAGLIAVLDAKAGTRHVYMTATVMQILRSLCAEHPHGALFYGRLGLPLQSIDKPFLSAVKECGLNDGVDDPRLRVCFHSLRHTFASWQAQRGVPQQVIADLLGHASTLMTQRYAKLAPSQSRAAIQGFEEELIAAGHVSLPCSVVKKPPHP
jgi:integrase